MQVYTYVKTMTVGLDINSRWIETIKPQETIGELCSLYRTALVVIFNTITRRQEALSIEGFRNSTVDHTQTLDAYLQSTGSATLATIAVPVIKPRLVRYRSAMRVGYQASTVKSGFADDANIPATVKSDLKLTRAGISYDDFNRYCLLTVNGYFHMSDVNSQGIYVNDAMKSVRKCGYNQIGLYNFREVGEIKKHLLSEALIFPSAPNSPLKDQLTIDLKINASSRYAIFFIGGYMVPATGSLITQTSDTTWSMAFNKFEWMDKFFEMSRFLDLTGLDILSSPTNENAFFKHDIVSDQTIRNLFKLPQSFVALVDTPSFFVDSAMLPLTRLPGMYRNYGKSENLPLRLGNGRMAEYWTTKDDGVQDSRGLFVADGYKFQRNYNTASADAALVVDPKRPAGHRIDLSDAWLLSMGRDF